MDGNQREFRQTKRKLKQLGSQRRRRVWKRELRERPEDAPYSEDDFGRFRTAGLNARDRDATRRPPSSGQAPPG
jgi:hypothetical protein